MAPLWKSIDRHSFVLMIDTCSSSAKVYGGADLHLQLLQKEGLYKEFAVVTPLVVGGTERKRKLFAPVLINTWERECNEENNPEFKKGFFSEQKHKFFNSFYEKYKDIFKVVDTPESYVLKYLYLKYSLKYLKENPKSFKPLMEGSLRVLLENFPDQYNSVTNLEESYKKLESRFQEFDKNLEVTLKDTMNKAKSFMPKFNYDSNRLKDVNSIIKITEDNHIKNFFAANGKYEKILFTALQERVSSGTYTENKEEQSQNGKQNFANKISNKNISGFDSNRDMLNACKIEIFKIHNKNSLKKHFIKEICAENFHGSEKKYYKKLEQELEKLYVKFEHIEDSISLAINNTKLNIETHNNNTLNQKTAELRKEYKENIKYTKISREAKRFFKAEEFDNYAISIVQAMYDIVGDRVKKINTEISAYTPDRGERAMEHHLYKSVAKNSLGVVYVMISDDDGAKESAQRMRDHTNGTVFVVGSVAYAKGLKDLGLIKNIEDVATKHAIESFKHKSKISREVELKWASRLVEVTQKGYWDEVQTEYVKKQNNKGANNQEVLPH